MSQVTESDKTVFAERGYTFCQLLGEGTYAKVWLVNYSKPDDNITRVYTLACKIIDNERSPKDFIKKFLPREIDILSKIRHPHLIHLHSIYQRKTRIFIFMRYAEKGDLLDFIIMNGEVRENRARLWTRQLSLGLQYLHNLDIVHRDIKCENVLITSNNNVKLADFGFSRFVLDTSGRRHLSSTYCGSIAYAAPELLKGKPYDPKCSDIWSLGIVLYVMLNQCMPFNDSDLKRLYDLQMNSEWSFRSKIASRLSEEVKILIYGMLRPDTATRFLINDVVNSSWFLADRRFKVMTEKEREALESGIKNKIGMLPKSHKFNVPFTKKGKKDEQVICTTSVRIELSSDQFNLDVSSSKIDNVNLTEIPEIKRNVKSKDDLEEVNKIESTTAERCTDASVSSEPTKKQSSVVQKLNETQVDDISKKHSAAVGMSHKGSNLSRTEKLETDNHTEIVISEKQSATVRRESSFVMPKSSDRVLNTDETSVQELIEKEDTEIRLPTIETKNETEKEITNSSHPGSEAKK